MFIVHAYPKSSYVYPRVIGGLGRKCKSFFVSEKNVKGVNTSGMMWIVYYIQRLNLNKEVKKATSFRGCNPKVGVTTYICVFLMVYVFMLIFAIDIMSYSSVISTDCI